MSCRRDDVGVHERRVELSSGDETGDVRHIGHQQRANAVARASHACIVDRSCVGARAGDDQIRSERGGASIELVVVDAMRSSVDFVRLRFKEQRARRRRNAATTTMSMRQMTTMCERKTHQSTAVRREERHVDAEIRQRARQRLHIHRPLVVAQTEQRQRSSLT